MSTMLISQLICVEMQAQMVMAECMQLPYQAICVIAHCSACYTGLMNTGPHSTVSWENDTASDYDFVCGTS